MSFITQSGSKQYVVDYGQKFIVDNLQAQEGSVIDLPILMSFGDTKGVSSLQAKVVSHKKGKKIRIVKYRAKSNYHRQYGHRPYQTVLEVLAPGQKDTKEKKSVTESQEA